MCLGFLIRAVSQLVAGRGGDGEPRAVPLPRRRDRQRNELDEGEVAEKSERKKIIFVLLENICSNLCPSKMCNSRPLFLLFSFLKQNKLKFWQWRWPGQWL